MFGRAAHGYSIISLTPTHTHRKCSGASQIAEEVEKVSPDLVVRGEDGKVTTVRYEAVNAMLLNEFLKEHQKVQRLEATAEKQQKQIEALTATVQKVSNQLELNKAVPQVVASNQ